MIRLKHSGGVYVRIEQRWWKSKERRHVREEECLGWLEEHEVKRSAAGILSFKAHHFICLVLRFGSHRASTLLPPCRRRLLLPRQRGLHVDSRAAAAALLLTRRRRGPSSRSGAAPPDSAVLVKDASSSLVFEQAIQPVWCSDWLWDRVLFCQCAACQLIVTSDRPHYQ